MKKYFCKTKCFYGNRLWTPGETLESIEGEKVPLHFTAEVPAVVQEPKGPVAFSEMTSREAVQVNPERPTPLSQYGKGLKKK